MSRSGRAFPEEVPKAEIHLHLEGAVDLETLLELRRRQARSADDGARRRLAALYEHEDFPQFLRHFRDLCAELLTPEDFALITTRLAQRLEDERVRHAEVMVSPQVHARRGLPADEILDAIAQAARAAAQGGPRIRFLLDGVRQWGPGGMEDLVELADRSRRFGVIGIGMGGDESSHPTADFAAAYREARRLGLRTTVHAGEFAGPRSVWEAIELLRVDRIGHGIRSIEEPELVRALKDLGLPLECCPTSNLRTRVVASWSSHPIAALHRSGVRVTVGTDDPAMFGATLNGEWRALHERAGLRRDQVLAIGRATIDAAFMDDGERAALVSEFEAAQGELEGEG